MKLGKTQKLILENWNVGEVENTNEIFFKLHLEHPYQAKRVLRSVDRLCGRGILEHVGVFEYKRLK